MHKVVDTINYYYKCYSRNLKTLREKKYSMSLNVFFIESALPHWAICDVFVRVAMQSLWKLSRLYLLPCV